MSYRKEAHKARLMAAGMEPWKAEMVAAEADLGGMAGVIGDARIFANVHGSRSVFPDAEPTARERAQAEAEDRARREQEAKWEEARERSRAAQDEWNRRR